MPQDLFLFCRGHYFAREVLVETEAAVDAVGQKQVAIAGGTAGAGEHLVRPGVERRQLLLGEIPLADVAVKEADRRVDDQRLDAANMRETVEPGVRRRRLRLLRRGRERQVARQRREGVLDAGRQPRLVQPRVDERVAAAGRPARQPPAQPLHVPPPHRLAHRRAR